MLRRLSVAGLSLGLVLLVFAVAPSARAQDSGCTTTYNGAEVACAVPTPTSSFGGAFAQSDGPSPDTIPTPAPTPVPEEDDADAPQLAFTGNESDVLAYVGSGLIAFGALALAAHRRLHED